MTHASAGLQSMKCRMDDSAKSSGCRHTDAATAAADAEAGFTEPGFLVNAGGRTYRSWLNAQLQ